MNGNKVLVTGSHGMLGSNLMKLFPSPIIGYNSNELDITNSKQCIDILEREKPDIIIHTAAYTDVENSEVDSQKAYKVNSTGTQNLVNYCIGKDVLFIYISSTGIYGSTQEEGYKEFDKLSPTTVHHKSKYEAEKIVKNHLNKYLILRTGWLFGGDTTHSKNFVYKRYIEATNNKEICSDNTQIGNPTSIKDLIQQIQVLIEHNQYGIFNCVNRAENISRYQYVKEIVKLFNQDCKVKIASQGIFNRVAPVSNNESAINYKLDILDINVMGDWKQSLKFYIEELKATM